MWGTSLLRDPGRALVSNGAPESWLNAGPLEQSCVSTDQLWPVCTSLLLNVTSISHTGVTLAHRLKKIIQYQFDIFAA